MGLVMLTVTKGLLHRAAWGGGSLGYPDTVCGAQQWGIHLAGCGAVGCGYGATCSRGGSWWPRSTWERLV